MLYLVTGANGAGKTLNTLKWVAERAAKESRPVCHNGRFEPVEGGALASWKKVDFKDWQNEPDGTIFLIDECHNDLPLRPSSAPVPDPVKMLAEHRRRGMDFYLVTQHPQNIDTFVRRLIGSPGWHRHLKRTFGADLVSVLEWSAVNPNCEKSGAGNSGTVTMQAFPKEVYGWYKSASLHTGKTRIPKKVYFAVAAAILGPLLLYLGVRSVYQNTTKRAVSVQPSGVVAGSGGGAGPGGVSVPASAGYAEKPVKSFAAFVQESEPRVSGLPHTAPKYDDATRPTRVPVPAACVEMESKGCKCYTQQGTLIPGMPRDLCSSIVRAGYFMDFEPDGGRSFSGQQGGPARGGSTHPQPVPSTEREAWTPGEIARLSVAKTGNNIFAKQDAVSSMPSAGGFKAPAASSP